MKKKQRKAVSILLVIAMLFTLVPASAFAATADQSGTKDVKASGGSEYMDEFGITKDPLTTDEKNKLLKKGPTGTGTDRWAKINTVNELFTGVTATSRWTYLKSDFNGNSGKKGSIPGSQFLNGAVGKNHGGVWETYDSAAFDPNGTGKDDHIVTTGVWNNNGDRKFDIAVVDATGDLTNRKVRSVVPGNNALDHMDSMNPYEQEGCSAVAAGDFDGDGHDSIVHFRPWMYDWSPNITECMTDGKDLDKERRVTELWNIMDLPNNSDGGNTDYRKLRNMPKIQMVAADVDRDSVDELIVTTSMSQVWSDSNGNLASRLFIFDLHNVNNEWKWQETKRFVFNGYTGGVKDAKRLRYCTSSVGNVIRSDAGTDYPEIVTAGWVDTAEGDDTSIDSGNHLGVQMTSCTGTTLKDGAYVGTYNSIQQPAVEASEFTKAGLWDSTDDLQDLIQVAVFAAQGPQNPAFVLIDDTVYKYEAGEWKYVYRDGYFNKDSKVNGNTISNANVVEATVGNFNGDPSGRQQVMFATLQKEIPGAGSDYYSRVFCYDFEATYNSDGDMTGEKWRTCRHGSDGATNNSNNWPAFNEDNDTTIVLEAVDTDNDSVIARLVDVERNYTDPKVLGLLEASPYFGEIDGGEIGNSETTYGTVKGQTIGSTSSSGLSANIVTGFEWSVDDICAGFVCGAGVEATVDLSWDTETSEEQTVEYSLDYSNDTGENQVLIYRRPLTIYKYELKNDPGSYMRVAQMGSLSTSMISMDEYNTLAEEHNKGNQKDKLPIIPEGTLATPGDPLSYHTSELQLKDCVTSGTTTPYSAPGTTSQGITYSDAKGETYSFSQSSSFTAYGMVFGAKVGGGGGQNIGYSNTVINTNSISKSGTVTGNARQGYDFGWEFAHWKQKIGDEYIPVLGYLIKDIVAPPTPPDALRVEDVTETTAKLCWDPSRREAGSYKVYRYLPDDNKYIPVAEVAGTDTECLLTGLKPGTTTMYVMRAFADENPGSSTNVRGASVPTDPVAVSTRPEGVPKVTISGPNNQSVGNGKTAKFSVDVDKPAEYGAVTYQWQVQKGNRWENIEQGQDRVLTLENVGMNMNGNRYRCEVSTLYNERLLYFYSKVATLSVGRDSMEVSMSVEGAAGGEGSLALPYQGVAEGRKYIGTKDVTVDVPVVVDHNGQKILICKQPNETYYGRTETGEYYQVTKGGASGYEIGSKITETRSDKYYNRSGKTFDQSLIPDTFNRAVPKTVTKDNIVYDLMAQVTGPVQNTGDQTMSGAAGIHYICKLDQKYYEYDAVKGEPGVPIEAPEFKNSDLYNVFVADDTNKVVLGREEKVSGKTDFWYHILTKNSGGTYDADVFKIQEESDFTVNGKLLKGFDPKLTDIVTEKQTITQDEYELQGGTSLTLKATVNKVSETLLERITKAFDQVGVTFVITNTETNEVYYASGITGVTGVAEATWRAPKAGLYQIQAVTDPSKEYVSATSNSVYYDASVPSGEEYRLVLKNGEVPFTGTVEYRDGLNVQLDLQKRTTASDNTSAWESVTDGIQYSVVKDGQEAEKTMITESTYSIPLIGNYSFRAEFTDGSKEPIVAVLKVNPVALRIYPVLKDNIVVPKQAEDVLLKVERRDGQETNLTSADIAKYITVNIPESTNAGSYKVTLSYNEAEANLEAFKTNYPAILESLNFVLKADSAPVQFSSGENGTLQGLYSDNQLLMTSGDSKSAGQKLLFRAVPNKGYEVDCWYINGEKYENQPGFEIKDNTLIMNSFDGKALNVKVTFIKDTNMITYAVDGNSGTKLSATVSKGDSGENPLASNTTVALGSDVTIHAAIPEGYVVDYWVVNGNKYFRDDKVTLFRGNDLILKNVRQAKSVVLHVKAISDKLNIITQVYDEANKPVPENAIISAVDADNGNAVDLKAVKSGSSLTFKAKLASETNNMVKEWQTSTDNGASFQTVKGSGAQTEITLYNLEKDTIVRAVVTTEQKYDLKWVIDDDGTPLIVPEEAKASLKVTSNGQALKEGKQSAYIPVEFELSLDNSYYVVKWEQATVDPKDPRKATIDTLSKDTKVIVHIKKKPVITWDESKEGGIVTVSGIRNGESGVDIKNGDYVDNNTDIKVTLKPNTGYVVGAMDDVTLKYTDGDKNGKTTDDKAYMLNAITTDQTVRPVWKKLAEYPITYSVVDTNGDKAGGTNGKLGATAERKGMTNYDEAYKDFVSGNRVYDGSSVTFTAKPDTGYRVKEWKVNDKVVENNTTDTLSLAKDVITKDMNVSVQFTKLGGLITVAAADTNGKITSVMAENKEQVQNIKEGFTLAEGAKAVITAKPAPGYEVESWTVNGKEKPAAGNTYTHTADKLGAHIIANFQQVEYPVTFSGSEGTVIVDGHVSGDKFRGGSEVVFQVKVNPGHKLTGWSVNGEKVDTGIGKDKLTWIVPNGLAQNPPVDAFNVKALFDKDSYDVMMKQTSNGTIKTRTDLSKKIVGGTRVTFTATPKEGYILESWNVNGQVEETRALSKTVTVNETTTVSAKFVPAEYAITFTAGENGKVTAPGVSERNVVKVPYGGSITLTAIPDAYYFMNKWTLDGETVTEGLNEDKTQFTITNVREAHQVKASFKGAVGFEVGYQVVNPDQGKLSVTADGEPLVLKPDEKQSITGDAKLVFTAKPNDGRMVKEWKVNGTTVTKANMEKLGVVMGDEKDLKHPLSNKLVITALDKATMISVEYEAEKLHKIPVTETNYVISDVIRAPYVPGNVTKVRDRGDVTFTVAPSDNQHYFTKLVIYGVDILKNENIPQDFQVKRNENGSYTVSIENVTKDIEVEAIALLRIQKKDLNQVPVELKDKFENPKQLQETLRTAISNRGNISSNEKNTKLFEIELQYSKDGKSWTKATKDQFPKDGIQVFIPYTDLGDVNKDYKFTVIHMFTTDMNGNKPGEMEVIRCKNTEEGITFKVDSLSPFAIAWKTPGEAGGGGGGFIPAGNDITIHASENGKVIADTENAFDGQTVTLTVTPNAGKALNSLKVFTDKKVPVVVTEQNGKYTFIMPNAPVDVYADFRCNGGAHCPSAHLIDVDKTAWYHEAVDYVVENKIMGGLSENQFAPDVTTSRGMIVTMLYRLEGEPELTKEVSFKDVSKDAWYAKAVAWAAANDVVSGYSAELFGPEDDITREQMASILYRYADFKGLDVTAKADLGKYEDADKISPWALNVLKWANAEGYITGVSDTMIEPGGNATRAQVAAILMRFCEDLEESNK